jgi:hypothetical protein
LLQALDSQTHKWQIGNELFFSPCTVVGKK